MNSNLRCSPGLTPSRLAFSLIGLLACGEADVPAGAPGSAGAGGAGGAPSDVVSSTSAGVLAGGGPADGAGGAQNGAGGAQSSGGVGGDVSGTGSAGHVSGAGGAGDPSAGGSGGGAPAEPVFHVFLLLGQSNMAGYPKASDADKTENPRIKVLGFDACAATGRAEGKWDIAAPPLHECWNGAIGPGDYFSKTILDHYPAQDTVGLVPSAISGEKVETFMKAGGSKYSWILSRAKAAQEIGGVIEGILFHQGESNCGDPAWPGKVKTLVSDLRADLKIGDVPFLAGELLYSGSCAKHNSLVKQLPGLIPHAFAVSAEGLAMDPADTWNLHFGHDAQVTLGKRYAETMIGALGL
ncbi:sialate O-acetylesterase [Sorangium sp. So ce1000]|uniref:sialate O-acetylesterase n=1 Tax=Sorangium sp. So ce1000 TaxID=3133325 RepID=UPI003F5DB886